MNKAYRPYAPRLVEIPYESVPFARITFCLDSEDSCGTTYPQDARNLSLICNETNQPFIAIVGIAYPGETLSAFGLSSGYQWYVDGSPVIGETNNTYIIKTRDIGCDIRCDALGLQSNILTCWHPRDENGAEMILVANEQLFTDTAGTSLSTGPTQTIARLDDISGNGYFAQRGSAFGYESVTFDSPSNPTNNWQIRLQTSSPSNSASYFDINGTTSDPGDIFRNKQYGYLISGCRATNPSSVSQGGSHRVAWFGAGTTESNVRLGIYARRASGELFAAVSRIDDAIPAVTASSPANTNYNVLTAYGNWANGEISLRVNGVTQDTQALASSGNTSDTRGTANRIGIREPSGLISTQQQFVGGRFNSVFAITPNSPLTPSALSRLERFAGLLGGLNIPLV